MSSSQHSKIVKSKLTFKGDNHPSHKRKIHLDHSPIIANSSKTNDTVDSSKNQEDIEIKIQVGTGRITSSATVIHGHYTKFLSELEVGDALIIMHPMSLVEETKIVRMVLSDTSISISSPFSSDLISTTLFKYIKAPKDRVEEESKSIKQEMEKKRKMEEEAFGTYASNSGEKIVYRVKKTGSFGGYKIITETSNENISRGSLLDIRSKKKSDRHCY